MRRETWRPVVGYEDCYEVSDRGRVRSIERRIVRRDGRPQLVPTRVLRTQRGRGGYPVLHLCRAGVCIQFRVHRLVLEAFIGPCPPGEVGCHNDGDPTNNMLGNLRWDTQAENIRDVIRHGHHHNVIKTHCANGHEYTPENTRRFKTSRSCRECHREKNRRYRARRSEAAA